MEREFEMGLTRMEKRTIQLVAQLMVEWDWVIDVATVTRYVNEFTPVRVTSEQVEYVLREQAA